MNRFLIAIAALTALAACSDRDHGAEKPVPEEHGHGHGGGISVTHFSDTTELFVEFPPLAKGQESAFAAHLTRLADFKAVNEGKLIVSLTGSGKPEERAEATVSATPGIFRPVLTPQHVGKRRLTFQLTLPTGTATHDIGEVTVYSDHESAKKASATGEGDEGITFTKEQQWQIDFALQPAIEHSLRESIPVTAIIRPRASGEAHIAAPGAGLVRPARSGFPEVGMRVSTGQVLAYLAPRLGGETDVATLQLAVERGKLEAEHARHERERLEGLFKAEAIPEKRLIEARSRERLAQAELSAAQRRAATYQQGSGGIALKAPISGTIVAVGAAPGSAVTGGETIFHIADLSKLWLEARVPETDVARITTPDGVFFRLDGEESPVVLEAGKNARLIAFGGLVDKETRTVPAIFEFDNPGGRLRAGMNIRASLYTGRAQSSVVVPASAVIDDNGQPVVFVQQEGESFERRIVTLGARDGDRVAVRSGVKAGERVVTKGAYQVRLAATAPAAMGHGHAH